ncbi:hypothetical protein [Bifidobacterium jacchi]|nr:hypothetical protein [Bifidobacterium jacchi]
MTTSIFCGFPVISLALGVLLGLSLNLVLHELGHVIGGLIDRYRLVAVRLGFFLLLAPETDPKTVLREPCRIEACRDNLKCCPSDDDRWHCLLVRGMKFFTVMVPTTDTDVGRLHRYRWFILGGIVGNSLMIVTSASLLICCVIKDDMLTALPSVVWHLAGVAIISIAKWCDNAIPRMHDGVGNDAWICDLLRASEQERQDFRCYMVIYAVVSFGWRGDCDGMNTNNVSIPDILSIYGAFTSEQATGYYATAITELLSAQSARKAL